MRIGGKDISLGSKTYVSIKVTTDLDGGEISIPIHVVAGAKPGPSLALLNLVHGSEWLFLEAFRRFVKKIQPSDLAGTVIVVPVSNPVAFGNYLNRITRDESDNADLNRVFPGHFTWITEQLASKLAEEVLANSDYLIDFHSGIWGSTLGAVMCGTDYPNAEVVRRSEEVARAFGYPCIHRGEVMSVFPGPRSSMGYFGGVLRKASIGVEIGGAGFDEALEEKWIDMNLTGIDNVMKHLKMLKGEPKLPEKYLVFRKRWRQSKCCGHTQSQNPSGFAYA